MRDDPVPTPLPPLVGENEAFRRPAPSSDATALAPPPRDYTSESGDRFGAWI